MRRRRAQHTYYTIYCSRRRVTNSVFVWFFFHSVNMCALSSDDPEQIGHGRNLYLEPSVRTRFSILLIDSAPSDISHIYSLTVACQSLRTYFPVDFSEKSVACMAGRSAERRDAPQSELNE